MDQSYAHQNLKPSSGFNNVRVNRAPDGAMAETLAAILTGARILTAGSYVKCFSDRKIMAISNEITGHILAEEAGAACT